MEVKQITLRLPKELYNDLARRGDEINCSANSMIMFLVKLGLKIYDAETVNQIVCKSESDHTPPRNP